MVSYKQIRPVIEMKSNFHIIVLFLLISASIMSCQKSPINGDLDGMWQVMNVTPEPELQPIEERLYYNFYLHVCTLSYYGGGVTTGNMIFTGDSLFLDFPNAQTTETLIKLKQYGINSDHARFRIEKLNRSSLIMSSGETTVTLRKF